MMATSASEIPLLGHSVWLTSQWGFDPHLWGYVGFADEVTRRSFLEKTSPGVLMAVYVTKNSPDAPKDELGRLVGVLELSHEKGDDKAFMDPAEYLRKQRDESITTRWRYGVRAVRAWSIQKEYQPRIEEFATESYSVDRARYIGAYGTPLAASEIERLALLPVEEVPVYGQELLSPLSGSFVDVLRPTPAVPPGLSREAVEEIIGPRHLYILTLDGDVAGYLGRPAGAVSGKLIIKVGLSHSPQMRCRELQAALPKGSYFWKVMKSTFDEGRPAFPSFDIARVGEDKMKVFLETVGAESLGGEFFLAERQEIEGAWLKGKAAATNAFNRTLAQ